MREFSISIEINAPAYIIWQTLMEFDHYHDWNPLFTVQQWELRVGGFLDLAPIKKNPKSRKRSNAIIRTKIEAIDEQQQLVLSRCLMHSSLVHMVHYFEINPSDRGTIIFSQRWLATGVLIPLMWRTLCKAMARFDQLNQALKSHAEHLGNSDINSDLGDK